MSIVRFNAGNRYLVLNDITEISNEIEVEEPELADFIRNNIVDREKYAEAAIESETEDLRRELESAEEQLSEVEANNFGDDIVMSLEELLNNLPDDIQEVQEKIKEIIDAY